MRNAIGRSSLLAAPQPGSGITKSLFRRKGKGKGKGAEGKNKKTRRKKKEYCDFRLCHLHPITPEGRFLSGRTLEWKKLIYCLFAYLLGTFCWVQGRGPTFTIERAHPWGRESRMYGLPYAGKWRTANSFSISFSTIRSIILYRSMSLAEYHLSERGTPSIFPKNTYSAPTGFSVLELQSNTFGTRIEVRDRTNNHTVRAMQQVDMQDREHAKLQSSHFWGGHITSAVDRRLSRKA